MEETMYCSREYHIVRSPMVLVLEPTAYVAATRRQYNVIIDGAHISAAVIMEDLLEMVQISASQPDVPKKEGNIMVMETSAITDSGDNTSRNAVDNTNADGTNVASNATAKTCRGKIAAVREEATVDETDGQDPNHRATNGSGFLEDNNCVAPIGVPWRRSLPGPANDKKPQDAETGTIKRSLWLLNKSRRSNSNLRNSTGEKDQAALPTTKCELDMERLKKFTDELTGMIASGPTASMEIPAASSKGRRVASLPPYISQLKKHQVARLAVGPCLIVILVIDMCSVIDMEGVGVST
ncbi:uncharacterized protein BCR38DRAFT_406289 [Pseudomassariella vexata]|uniref:Uncharacterized protein n=1 Tax=Pseudomassariella vexata TaxID=1141098 RepID=A0A1Y2EBY5_9PEZI|nr:uncharacterized protein BCR38DRAFT_406289 [Pseudomassariella vexata]ORY68355.1 hypothetical protein BCR38DRAFT_406289 [Pseudomassariella vexata]